MAKGIPSVMSHTFSEVPKAMISRSSFDRSHGYKTTFDASYLVPIYLDEALPGDTFNLNMTGFARLATPIKPIMDNIYMETFFFAVPNRLVWDKWEDFMGNQATITGATTLPHPAPQVENEVSMPVMTLPPSIPQAREQSIFDYMGLPINSDANVVFNSMPFRCYNLIYNEWFRDQNLCPEVPVLTGDTGADQLGDYVLLRRGKRHDYFTSCLPWEQKGEAVTIPTLGSAPVVTDNTAPTFTNFPGGTGTAALYGSPVGSNAPIEVPSQPAGSMVYFGTGGTGLQADLTGATTATINDLRVAFQLQKMLERDARGGTRYTEVIHAHFGVTSPDARLQRPEYLGGGRTRVNINPVQQTTPSDIVSDVTPQGNLAGYGTASLMNHGFTKSFTEHCYIIGLVNVRADLTYQEGLDRMWARRGRYDFFWPAFQHVGEQEVRSDEIYASSENDTTPVFGYQERYAEYRYKPSKITGKFRSNAPDSLDIWHLSQDFATAPVLNQEFIEEDVPIDRVIAIPTEPHFLFDAYFKLRTARPMPLYGVPGNIDRF